MAITEAAVTSGTGLISSSQATASVTPTANRLQLLVVMSAAGVGGGTPNTPTVTGNGLTWVQIGTPTSVQSAGIGAQKATLFRAMGASPTTGVATIDFAAQTQTEIVWSWAEFDGIRTTGSNGADAVRQIVTASDDTGTSSTSSATQTARLRSASGSYAAIANNQARTATPGTGYTEIHDLASTHVAVETVWRASAAVSESSTLSSTGDWIEFLIELRDTGDDPASDTSVPTIASTSSSKTGNTNADITITFSTDGPSTANASNAPTAGDLYIVSGENADFTPVTTVAVATPTGFTAGPSSFTSSGSRHGLFTFYKVMDGTETSIVFAGTPNDTTGGLTAKVIRIAAGTFNSTLITSSTAAQNVNNTSINLSGVTTSVDNTLVMYFFGCAAGTTKTVTPPVELFEEWDFATDPGDASTHEMASIIQSLAGATGTKTFSPSATSLNAGVCIAVAPAASGAAHVAGRLPILGVG